MEIRFDPAKLIAPIAVVGGALFLISTHPGLYVTRPGHATVVFNSFTGLQPDRVSPPGVSFITPMVERPITYTVWTQVWEFTDSNSPNRISNAIKVNSSDGQAFSIDVYVAMRPNQMVLDNLHAEIGENYREIVVVPVVRAKVRDVSGEFDSEDFYQQEKRIEIENRLQELIAEEMPTTLDGETQEPLILIEGVFLGTPNFPQGLKDSIERKQVASITAQTAEVRAEIQIKETERKLILAEADQTAIELKGEAAAINAKLSDLLFYELLEQRLGASDPLRVIRVEGDSTLFLNVDSESAAANIVTRQ